MSGAGKIFITEFLDKHLVDFGECQEHYARFTPDQLIEEMDFLFGPEALEISLSFTYGRYNAFLVAIIKSAANFREISDDQRSALVHVAITIIEYLLEHTPEEEKESFETALSATLESVKTYGLFPKVAELIKQRIRNYKGSFEVGVIGEILEKE